MTFDKCDKCEHSVKANKAKRNGQRYTFPLLFFFSGLLMLAYERNSGNQNLIVTVMGGLSAAAGFAWLIVKGVRYYRS